MINHRNVNGEIENRLCEGRKIIELEAHCVCEPVVEIVLVRAYGIALVLVFAGEFPACLFKTISDQAAIVKSTAIFSPLASVARRRFKSLWPQFRSSLLISDHFDFLFQNLPHLCRTSKFIETSDVEPSDPLLLDLPAQRAPSAVFVDAADISMFTDDIDRGAVHAGKTTKHIAGR